MPAAEWQSVCRLEELGIERGAAALVHGRGVAIFRLRDGSVYALDNHDPQSRTSSLARGLVGTTGGVPYVVSPAHRRAFDLRTGDCLDDDEHHVAPYAVRIVDGIVQIGPRLKPGARADEAS